MYGHAFDLNKYKKEISSPSAFAGGTSNARGNDGGTNDPLTLYTVTGVVAVRIFGFCTTDLAGATAKLEVGTAKSTAGLIAQTTATDIDANEIWHDATPDNSIEALTVAPQTIVGQDIIETVVTTDITAGQIYYVCLWQPLSADGNLVSAV